MHRQGILCVVSGPSGSGKTTLCHKLKEKGEATYSISCTTRPPREGETDGKDYHFLTETDFTTRVENGDFLEHARVHGNLYGTLKSTIIAQLETGTDVIMDIDVQGAEQIRACNDPFIRSSHIDVFIMPPTIDELRKRLASRGTESDEQVQIRMKNALAEIDHWRDYHYTILSATPEEDFANFLSLITAERLRTPRLPNLFDE